MTICKQTVFRKTLLATLIGAALVPGSAWALDLAQSPPGTVEPYVAPNVIVSIDDSGSMAWRLDRENATGATNQTVPPETGWPVTARRMNVLKHALREVFNDTELLPEGKIRLAWQTMHNNGGTPGAETVNSAARQNNSMSVLTATHRANFLDFVGNLVASGGTPTHKMFSQADAYLRRSLDVNSAFASVPGEEAEPYLGCRRNYHIVMTDGRWNSTTAAVLPGGNVDGTARTLPDGTAYNVTSPQTRVYRDGHSNTIADWAFRSWADNLQPSLYSATDPNKQVSPSNEYRNAPATENVGGLALQKYWNPKYNPANWPHLVTYTIGFSQMAYTWNADISRPTEMVPFGFDGDFPSLVTGSKTWPAMSAEAVRALDMWHAAINGRGRFFAVEKGEDLERAFRMIIEQIRSETEANRGSTAASGSNAMRNDVGMFTANYDPMQAWKGWINGFKVIANAITDGDGNVITPAGATVPIPEWEDQSTADRLDAMNPDQRVILSWNDASSKGVPFRWGQIPASYFGSVAGDGQAENRFNYIRGDRSNEGTASSALRERVSRQGDIVNSQIWYAGAPVSNYSDLGYLAFASAHSNRLPMIYVGGNDGMLHGFSAADGYEKLAYVPRGVLPGLKDLTEHGFDEQHRYFVDGSPMTGDVDIKGAVDGDGNYVAEWSTLLVGTLGAGGKGYFVLDVTDPSEFDEGNAEDLVVLDRTRHASEPYADCTVLSGAAELACLNNEVRDLGHIFAQPVRDAANPMSTTQITKLNDGRWAVVVGNGYNSQNQRPVLLIQYLDGAMELKRLVAANGADGQSNGLSAPRLVDINGDGKPDVVYAGDIQGNLWKFDITSPDPADWGTAFGGQPLYTAYGPATMADGGTRSLRQPITAAPTVLANDRTKVVKDENDLDVTVRVKGMMVAFGTGRNVTWDDPASAAVQSLYSVLDPTHYKRRAAPDREYIEVHPGDDASCVGVSCVPQPLPVGSGVANLARQSVGSTAYDGQLASAGRTFWTVDETEAVDWNEHEGWYMDLPVTGERLLKPMELYDSSNLLAVFSQVPARGSYSLGEPTESCEAVSVDDERQFLTLLNIMDGKSPSVQLMDANGDGRYSNPHDSYVSRKTVNKGPHKPVTFEDHIEIDAGKLARMPEQVLRPSWHQLQ